MTGWDARAAIADCPIEPWTGDVWRCHNQRYEGTDASGSLKVTGRFNKGVDAFNTQETWPALYTSMAQHVALGERLRHTTPATLAALANQRISRLHVELDLVMICCLPDDCSALSIPQLTIDDLCGLAK